MPKHASVKTTTKGKIDLGSMSKSEELIPNLSALIDDTTSDVYKGEQIGVGIGQKWGKDSVKPPSIVELYRQIHELFNVGTEVEGYAAFYFPPPKMIGKKFESPELLLGQADFGIAARMILVIGTREVAQLAASAGGRSGEGKLMIGKNRCVSLPLGFCSGCTITFSNAFSESLPAMKGHRDTNIKKNPLDRHILIFDLSASASILTQRIQKEIAAAKGGVVHQPDTDAAIARVTAGDLPELEAEPKAGAGVEEEEETFTVVDDSDF
jgi:hypothetical protein